MPDGAWAPLVLTAVVLVATIGTAGAVQPSPTSTSPSRPTATG